MPDRHKTKTLFRQHVCIQSRVYQTRKVGIYGEWEWDWNIEWRIDQEEQIGFTGTDDNNVQQTEGWVPLTLPLNITQKKKITLVWAKEKKEDNFVYILTSQNFLMRYLKIGA